jgi:hypothetical protein
MRASLGALGTRVFGKATCTEYSFLTELGFFLFLRRRAQSLYIIMIKLVSDRCMLDRCIFGGKQTEIHGSDKNAYGVHTNGMIRLLGFCIS